MSKIKRLTNELKRQYKPVGDISDIQSLEDGFVMALLQNSKYGQQVAGFSIIELSKWLQEHNIKTDFDLYSLIFN